MWGVSRVMSDATGGEKAAYFSCTITAMVMDNQCYVMLNELVNCLPPPPCYTEDILRIVPIQCQVLTDATEINIHIG